MHTDVLDRAAALLRRSGAGGLPLDRLRDAVAPVTSRATLADWLRDDPRFRVRDARDPLADLPLDCEPGLRSSYRAALGPPATPSVELVSDDADPGGPAELLATSFRDFAAGACEPVLAHRIAEARAEYGALLDAVLPHSGR